MIAFIPFFLLFLGMTLVLSIIADPFLGIGLALVWAAAGMFYAVIR